MPVNFDPEALGGPGESVAVGGFESIKIFDQGREIASLHAAGGDVTALAWNEPLASLLCGNEDMGVARQDDVLATAFSPSMKVAFSWRERRGWSAPRPASPMLGEAAWLVTSSWSWAEAAALAGL